MIRIAVIMGKMNSGGKKNLAMEYYRHIDRNQIQFDFLCDADSNAIPKEEIEALGGRVYIVRPYQNIFGNMKDIYRICRENRYPVIHAYNSTMNLFPMLVAKQAGVPVRISESISMAHEGDWKTVLKKILKPMSKLFANRFMSNGEVCGRWQFGDKAYDSGKVAVFKTVINTGYYTFDPELREKTRQAFGWTDKIVIGHIGRLTYQKNSIRLIEMFSAIAKKEPKAVLCLIGDGELRDEVLKRISELQLTEQVSYLGRREDILQFYNAMDAFLLPSLYEGLPVVGVEAESCGLPMFFSTEIPAESSFCELGEFISLKEPDEVWADRVLEKIAGNMPVRRGRSAQAAECGFDSAREAVRLQEYYLSAVQ